jgi:hypothetical protein
VFAAVHDPRFILSINVGSDGPSFDLGSVFRIYTRLLVRVLTKKESQPSNSVCHVPSSNFLLVMNETKPGL